MKRIRISQPNVCTWTWGLIVPERDSAENIKYPFMKYVLDAARKPLFFIWDPFCSPIKGWHSAETCCQSKLNSDRNRASWLLSCMWLYLMWRRQIHRLGNDGVKDWNVWNLSLNQTQAATSVQAVKEVTRLKSPVCLETSKCAVSLCSFSKAL